MGRWARSGGTVVDEASYVRFIVSRGPGYARQLLEAHSRVLRAMPQEPRCSNTQCAGQLHPCVWNRSAVEALRVIEAARSGTHQ